MPYRGLPAGTNLNGIYAIDRIIGSGGMGEVYLGHEVQTGATVAIKMLLPEMAENEAALALFRREAAALLNLHHDSIVRYFLFTVEPTLQRPYLAMEFIDGRSLSDLLESGPLPYGDIVSLVRRVASGFHVAHERGLVHRDVSPDNIIIPHGGVSLAKIIDFGIARSTAIGDPTIIGDGFAGKHNYVSPEQVGLYGHDVTFKSDIYSFGLVLFNVATGQKLDMGGSQFQLVEKRRKVPDLSQVDVRLQPLLDRMLQPDPADRPKSMAEIADWLKPDGRVAVLPSRSNTHPSSARPATQKVGARRRPWFTAVTATIALLILGGGYAYYFVEPSNPSKRPVPTLPKLTQDPSLLKNDPAPIPPPNESVNKTEKQAALPTPPRPEPVVPANRVDSIRSYLDQYNGGDCFLILPVAISQNAAVLEGFGSSPAPFDAFAQAFRGKQGFNASVGMRQIAAPQCPAIKFVNALRTDRTRPPRISLDSVELKSGDVLSGTVENFANRIVELLLVTDKGLVQNLTSLLKPGTDSMSFTIGLQRNQPDAAPQLLIAIVSSQPLNSLRGSQPIAADIFFPQVLKDAKEANISITTATRFFTLEK